jgi:hypothetical protein
MLPMLLLLLLLLLCLLVLVVPRKPSAARFLCTARGHRDIVQQTLLLLLRGLGALDLLQRGHACYEPPVGFWWRFYSWSSATRVGCHVMQVECA